MTKILIIEDDIYIRENFSEIFIENGYDVVTASDGNEGIEAAKKIIPDLILCDIMMEGVDGYQVKEAVSLHKATSSVPFIFISAKSDLKDIRAGLSLGADDYITKPVSAKDLLKSVQGRLKRIEELQHRTEESRMKKPDFKKEKILVKTSGNTDLLNINEIVLISASGDYSTVFTSSSKKLLMKKSLRNWEKNLDEKIFLRIHRNKIININFIEKIEPLFKGAFTAKLKHYPDTIHFSQRCSVKIKKMLSLD